MARVFGKLSPTKVAKVTAPGLHADGGNLYLQVSPSGAKSWSFRFMLDSRAREMGLGPLHTIGLAEARARAAEARRLLLDRIDPIEHRQNSRQQSSMAAARAKSFEACADAYIKAHGASWSNAKHAQQWRATLSTYAYPVFGDLPVAAIDLGLVVQVLEPIWTAKPETATRLRGRIEAILDYAKTRGWRSGDNPARWKGVLENVLPAKGRIVRVKHHAALPWRGLPPFMTRFAGQRGIAAQALAFTILTAVRTGDVIGASWREFDLGQGIWTIPAARVKGRQRDHRVPLSKVALRIVREIASLNGSCEPHGFVFPGEQAAKGLSNMALLAVLRRMGRGDITTHGFRSTFRDWAAEVTDYRHEVVEAALAHVVDDKVVAAYRRTDFFDRRRDLMDDWGRFCLGSEAAKVEAVATGQ
jgi:integrase